jgi:hypothetical protein
VPKRLRDNEALRRTIQSLMSNGEPSLELGTWNLELGTWNLELGTWNLELGKYETKPGFLARI